MEAAIARAIADKWPGGSDAPAAHQLLRGIAKWLSTSPYPDCGAYRAQLPNLGHYLRGKLAHIYCNSAHSFPKLKTLVTGPDSHGVFMLDEDDRREFVSLNLAALGISSRASRAPAAAGRQPGHQMNAASTTTTSRDFPSAPGRASPQHQAGGHGQASVHDQGELLSLVNAVFPPHAADPPLLLRNAITAWLAASPEPWSGAYRALLASLGSYLAKQHAALWLNPEHSWPELRAFLQAPEGHGVLQVASGPITGKEFVELDAAALRRAASAATAAAAAPGRAAVATRAVAEGAANRGAAGTAPGARPPPANATALRAEQHEGGGGVAPFAAAEDVLRQSGQTGEEVLLRMIDAVFPPRATNPAVRLRHAVAAWLATSPQLELMGPGCVRLTTLGVFLSKEQGRLWLDPQHKWPKLKAFLAQPASQGLFTVGVRAGFQSEFVELNVEALGRAFAAAKVKGADVSASGGAAAPVTAVGGSVDGGRSVGVAVRAGGEAAASAGPPPPGTGALHAAAPPPAADVAAAAPAAAPVAETDAALTAMVTEAVATVWPGDDPVSGIRRCAVRQLASVRDGPTGPGSMLWAQVTSLLYKEAGRDMARLVAGGNTKKATALRTALDGACARGHEDRSSLTIIRIVQHRCDHVVRLDARALLTAWQEACRRRIEQQLWSTFPEAAPATAPGPAAAPTSPVACSAPAASAAAAADGVAAAKRRVALLLATSLPPYALFAECLLYEAAALAGAAVAKHGVQGLCAEHPGIFRLLPNDHEDRVRLVCPALLPLAVALTKASAALTEPADLFRAAEAAALVATNTADLEAEAARVRPRGAFGAATAGGAPPPAAAAVPPQPRLQAQSQVQHQVPQFGSFSSELQAAAGAPHTSNGFAAGPLPVPVPTAAPGSFTAPTGTVPAVSTASAATAAAAPAAAAAAAASSAARSDGGRGLEPHTKLELDLDSLLRLSDPAGNIDTWNRSALAAVGVYVISDPYGPDMAAALQHCHVTPHVGLTVQSYGGRPAVISLYAPQAAAADSGPASAAAGLTWPAAVYVLDCTACEELYGGRGTTNGEAAAAALLEKLAALLSDPGVGKVVHGCEQVHCLEAALGGLSSGGGASGASAVCPLMDTRVVLGGMAHMLGLPRDPEPRQLLAQSAAAGSRAAAAQGAAAEAAFKEAASSLHAHVGSLQESLTAIGLWSERPELLATLTSRHFAALREELWAVATKPPAPLAAAPPPPLAAAVAGNGAWAAAARPLSEAAVAAAAGGAMFLPELWTAMLEEAVPWVAVHAPLGIMERLRTRNATGTAGSPVLR